MEFPLSRMVGQHQHDIQEIFLKALINLLSLWQLF